jgi:hypothetical protein
MFMVNDMCQRRVHGRRSIVSYSRRMKEKCIRIFLDWYGVLAAIIKEECDISGYHRNVKD